MSIQEYVRPQAAELRRRLKEPRRFIQVVAGPRQVGKTTLVTHVAGTAGVPHIFASADEPTLRGPEWIDAQWEAARLRLRDSDAQEALLVLDEVQKVPRWSEAVKRLWDADTRVRRPLKVVLLGSAPLLVQQGMTESLAGRFEVVHLSHWTLAEMKQAFGWTVDQYIFYGGYPWRGAPGHRSGALGALRSRLTHRDHHLTRRAPASLAPESRQSRHRGVPTPGRRRDLSRPVQHAPGQRPQRSRSHRRDRRSTGDASGTVDLMLTFLEAGTEQAADLGYGDEAYFNALQIRLDAVAKAFDSLPVDVGAIVRARLGRIQVRARAVGWGWSDAVDEVVHALDARAARVGTHVRATRPAG